MQTALLAATPLVCFQIDRFFLAGNRTCKYFIAVHGCEQCEIPVFLDNYLDAQKRSYTLTAALIHVVTANHGHYQALLRLGNQDGSGGSHWYITDDDRPMRRMDTWPAWIPASLTLLWMCRTDLVSLPDQAPQPIDQDQGFASILNILAHQK